MKIATKVAALSSAVSATLILSTTSVFAAGTYVKVGGSSYGNWAFTATSSSGFSFMSDYGVPAECSSTLTMSGEIYAGVEVTIGNIIGKVTGFTPTQCTATSLGYPVTLTSSAPNWNIYVTSEPAGAGAPIPIALLPVGLYAHSTSPTVPSATSPWACEFSLSGSLNGTISPTLSGGWSADFGSWDLFDMDVTAFDGSGTQTPATSSCGSQFYTGDRGDMVWFNWTMVTVSGGAITHN